MKSFTIRSVHKNAILALSHASQLKREFNATVSTYQFTASGKRSRRGTHFTFVITPRKKSMWRIIVGFPYLLNKKKSKSPDSRTMKAIYYAKTKNEALSEKSRLRSQAKRELKKHGNKAWIQEKKSHPLYRKVNVQVSQVDFDERFIGITEFVDD